MKVGYFGLNGPLRGWSGGAKVLRKLSVPGRPTNLNNSRQGPIALVVGAGGVVWTFSLVCLFFLPLRYRL